jgi:DNA-binding transcriptional LysR family regulator
MKKLEELLGVRLIERSNRGSHLTPEGKAFYTKISHILGELEAVVSELPGRAAAAQPLAVGIMLSLGDVHMNRHLAYFQDHHSGASFRVYNLEVREMLQWLKDDRLDIVSLFYLPSLDLDDYEKVFFGTDDIVYYKPDLDVAGPSISACAVASEPLAQYSPQYEMNAYISRYFTTSGCPPQKTKAWFSTPYAMLNYCQQNHIGALLPERFLQAMGVGKDYCRLEPPIHLPCYLVYKKNNPKYAAIQVFVEYIRRVYHIEP